MVQIRKADAILAARSILVNLAFDETNIKRQVHLLLKLVPELPALASMAVSVFDEFDVYPNIYSTLLEEGYKSQSYAYATCLYQISNIRKRTGRKPLPIRFTDEFGRPNTVVYMSDYAHLRRAAA